MKTGLGIVLLWLWSVMSAHGVTQPWPERNTFQMNWWAKKKIGSFRHERPKRMQITQPNINTESFTGAFCSKGTPSDDWLSAHEPECCRLGFLNIKVCTLCSGIMASTPPANVKKASGWLAQLYLNGQCKYWASDKWVPLFSTDYHIYIPSNMRKSVFTHWKAGAVAY